MKRSVIYGTHYSITLPDFLEILAQERHKVNDEYLEYVADILLRYKFLDRPIITGDVKLFGRLYLNSLISKLNLSDTNNLESKFKYHKHHQQIIDYLNKTEPDHKQKMQYDRNTLGNMFRLNTICSVPFEAENNLPVDDHDASVYTDINNFFNTYKENYEKAYKDDRLNIPIFVGNKN